MGKTPGVGELAHKFELPDSTGKKRSLDELIGKGKLVLVFLRGMW